MAVTVSGQWGYSVPLDGADGNPRAPESSQDTFGSNELSWRPTKNTTRRPSADAAPAAGTPSDSDETRQQHRSTKSTHVAAPSHQRSRNALRDHDAPDPSADEATAHGDSAWIHRDKLAQIEIQEMVAAGIPVRQSVASSYAGPAADGRRTAYEELPEDTQMEEEQYDSAAHEDHRTKYTSTIHQGDDEDDDFDPTVDSELRTRDEVLAEQEHSFSSSPNLEARPVTSRIPQSTASPVPIPRNVVGRESPLPRSRAASGNWDKPQYMRHARNTSVGSQVLLDDDISGSPRPGSSHGHSPTNHSPPKPRAVSKVPPASLSNRKASAAGATGRPGSSVGKRTDQRANSLSGNTPRPPTRSQYPLDGDPPWITEMYKPDPRLPPDQQMLPTHARRLAQEQWEREGKVGTVHDQYLRLTTEHGLATAQNAASSSTAPAHELSVPSPPNHNDTIPSNGGLSPPKSPALREHSVSSSRPGTSGGYRITPTISTPPLVHRSPTEWSPQPGGVSAPSQLHPALRVPEPPEKTEAEGKKDGCACCVVM